MGRVAQGQRASANRKMPVQAARVDLLGMKWAAGGWAGGFDGSYPAELVTAKIDTESTGTL